MKLTLDILPDLVVTGSRGAKLFLQVGRFYLIFEQNRSSRLKHEWVFSELSRRLDLQLVANRVSGCSQSVVALGCVVYDRVPHSVLVRN